MIHTVSVILPIVSFLFQWRPRRYNRYFGVDVWSRLYEADLFRKNRHRIPRQEISRGFLLSGNFNYPPVFPFLLSFIPKKRLYDLQSFIAPFFDSIHVLLVYLVTYAITDNVWISVLAQTLYASIPLIILENSYLTPRSLGYVLFSLTWLPLISYPQTGNTAMLVISLFMGALMMLSHKFATQSYLFIALMFMVHDRSYLYPAMVLGSITLATFVSRGFYLRVLGGHIDNILFWTKNYRYRFAHQVRGLDRQEKRDFVASIYHLIGVFTPITLMGTNLWIGITFLGYAQYLSGGGLTPAQSSFLADPYVQKLTLTVIWFYVIGTAVMMIKRLTPIGEGQRYLEMAALPSAVIAAGWIARASDWMYAPLVFALAAGTVLFNISFSYLVQNRGIIADRNRSKTSGMDEVFRFINTRLRNPRILCIPHQITTMVVYHTTADVLVEIQAGHLIRIPEVFPILTKPVSEIAKKYRLNTLVLKTSYVTAAELGLRKKDLLFASNDTEIYKL